MRWGGGEGERQGLTCILCACLKNLCLRRVYSCLRGKLAFAPPDGSMTNTGLQMTPEDVCR